MWSKFLKMSCAALALILGAALWSGCASSKETANRDTLTEDVAKYPPGPSGVNKPRVGVPPFKVTTTGGFQGGRDLNDLAADQMNTTDCELGMSKRLRQLRQASMSSMRTI